MHLNIDSKINTYDKPNFKSAYTVQSALIDGVYYGNRQFNVLNRVATALSVAMNKKEFYPGVAQKVYKLFPDLKKIPDTSVAGSNMRKYKVNILSGIDAQRFRDNFRRNTDLEERQIAGKELLLKSLAYTGFKKLTIVAEQKAGKLIITDVYEFTPKIK